jgi:NAD(P)H-dependent flavin oxidoreductase YrpB (nitropropane dioxygenase family)
VSAPQTSTQAAASFVPGQKIPASVEIEAAKGPPEGAILIKTTKEQDAKVEAAAIKSMEEHNDGTLNYNLITNNCTDAACNVLESAGISVDNPATTVKPNSWMQELKAAKVQMSTSTSTTGGAPADKTNTNMMLPKFQVVPEKKDKP